MPAWHVVGEKALGVEVAGEQPPQGLDKALLVGLGILGLMFALLATEKEEE